MKRAPSAPDRAFVLRVSPYGESDAITSLLTERAGVVSAIAKRARASSGRRALVLEPFHTLSVELAATSGELVSLRSATIATARPTLLESAERLDAAGIATRWVRALSPSRVPEPAVFASLEHALDRLVDGAPPDRVTTAFGLELLETLGYGLELRGCARCARPRPEGRPAYVSGASGGVVCEACRRGVAFDAPLVAGAVLDRLAGDPWASLSLSPDDAAAAARVVRDAIAARTRAGEARA